MSSAKPRTLAELEAHPDVLRVWSEGADGHWLDARPGLLSPGTGCHVFHEWSVRDLCADFNGRQPCACAECKAAILSPAQVAALDFLLDNGKAFDRGSSSGVLAGTWTALVTRRLVAIVVGGSVGTWRSTEPYSERIVSLEWRLTPAGLREIRAIRESVKA